MSRIFHIATAADWEAARKAGRYTTSTRGRSLAEEGFIHASHADQWQGVLERFYGGVAEPLVLLAIDPERLTAPVVEEVAEGEQRAFPHIYGPLNADAVVHAIPLDRRGAPVGGGESFTRIFFQEMFRNVVAATVVLLVAVAGSLLGRLVHGEVGPLLGALVGLAVGVVLVRAVRRRRD